MCGWLCIISRGCWRCIGGLCRCRGRGCYAGIAEMMLVMMLEIGVGVGVGGSIAFVYRNYIYMLKYRLYVDRQQILALFINKLFQIQVGLDYLNIIIADTVILYYKKMYSHEYNNIGRHTFHTFHTSLLTQAHPNHPQRIQIHPIHPSQSPPQQQLYLKLLQTLNTQPTPISYSYSQPQYKPFAKILDQLNMQTQLIGDRAADKFRQAKECVVQYTDSSGVTQDVYKVLYLVFAYLGIQARRRAALFWTVGDVHKQVQDKQGKNISVQQMVVQWLIDAACLFRKQLQKDSILQNPPKLPQPTKKPPTKQNPPSRHKPPTKQNPLTKNNIRDLMYQQWNPSQQPPRPSPKSSQKYSLLLTLLQQNKLQPLIEHLQQLYKQINNQYSQQNMLLCYTDYQQYMLNSDEEEGALDYGRRKSVFRGMKKCLLTRINNVLNMLCRKVYGSAGKEQIMGDDDKDEGQTMQDPYFHFLFQQHQELTHVLKCMTSILLGNVTAIQQYCGKNVYMYLSMVILYADVDGLDVCDINSYVHQYLQNKYHVQLNTGHSNTNNKNKTNSIRFTHHYLLTLISLLSLPTSPTSKKSPSPPVSPLHIHTFFQQTISYFKNHQFYAYLIISIMFNMSMVNRQIYLLDEDYQINVHMQLLMCAAAHVDYVAHVQDNCQKGETTKQGKMLKGVSTVSNGNKHIDIDDIFQLNQPELRQKNSLQDEIDMMDQPFFSTLPPLPASSPSPSPPSPPPLSHAAGPLGPILFLRTLSFYRNTLMQSQYQKHLKLNFNIDIDSQRILKLTTPYSYPYTQQQLQSNIIMLSKQYQLSSRMLYHKLPLYQLIDNLLREVNGWDIEGTWQWMSKMRDIGRVVEMGDIGDCFLGYLGDLLALYAQKYGHTRLPNQYILDIMSLQLQLCLSSKYPYTSNPQLQSPPIYNTYTLALLHDDYLTYCTLSSPFDYTILHKMQQLTNPKSKLYSLSQVIAHQFYSYFLIYQELSTITKRGHHVVEIREQNQGKEDKQEDMEEVGKKRGSYSRKSTIVKKDNQAKLRLCMERINKLLAILYRHQNYACGQIVRVAWEVYQDYEVLKNQYSSSFGLSAQESSLLEQLANQVLIFFKQLRLYITSMQNSRCITEELNKFKKLIF